MLVDTNVISELARARPNAGVVSWFARQGRIHLSVVTLEELTFGVARAKGGVHVRLAKWLDALLAARPPILDVTPTIARASGELRAAREAPTAAASASTRRPGSSFPTAPSAPPTQPGYGASAGRR